MTDWNTPNDSFHVATRGLMFTYRIEPRPAGELRAMKGQEIIVLGKQYVIAGVETFMIPDHVRVDRVGFLVRERNEHD